MKKKIYDEVICGVETITPAMAQQMLVVRASNRNLKWRQVDALARDMVNGNWKLNGESIVVDSYGRLQNGEHRLRACIKAQVNFDTVVVRGVEPDSIKTIDQHQKRSAYDVFKINGVKNAATASAIARAVSTYRVTRVLTNTGASNYLPTATEIYEEYMKNSDRYEWAACLCREIYKEVSLLPPSVLGMMMYILVEEKKHDIEKVKDFFYQFADKAYICSPVIKLLRQKLYNDAISGTGAKLPLSVKTYYLIKTWNLWVEGRTNIKILQGYNKKDSNKIELI